MERWELYIPPEPITRNAVNGQFLKGHVPHNKGRWWKEWMPKEKQKKVLKCLELGRGNPNLPGWNKRAVVAVFDDGTFKVYSSGTLAAERLGLERRNINSVCNKKRKHVGGIRFFFENDNEWLKLIKQ